MWILGLGHKHNWKAHLEDMNPVSPGRGWLRQHLLAVSVTSVINKLTVTYNELPMTPMSQCCFKTFFLGEWR